MRKGGLEDQRSSRFPISTKEINKDDTLRQEEVFFKGETIRWSIFLEQSGQRQQPIMKLERQLQTRSEGYFTG